jgi:hypothetical protein
MKRLSSGRIAIFSNRRYDGAQMSRFGACARDFLAFGLRILPPSKAYRVSLRQPNVIDHAKGSAVAAQFCPAFRAFVETNADLRDAALFPFAEAQCAVERQTVSQ